MTAKREMERYVDTLDPAVKDNVEIVTPKDFNPGGVMHISTDPNIKNFTPTISQRTANNENRSVPRISAAPTLSGAILGYQGLEHDYELPHDKKEFRGGWYVYTLPFEYALKPNKKLVYDAVATEEVWLVPYQNDAWSVKSERVGKLFLNELTIRNTKAERSVSATIILEVSVDATLTLAPGIDVSGGYWTFHLSNFNPGWTVGR